MYQDFMIRCILTLGYRSRDSANANVHFPTLISYFIPMSNPAVLCSIILVYCIVYGAGIVQSVSSGCGLNDQGIGVRFPVGANIFIVNTVLEPALGPTQPPIQCVSKSVSPRVKRPGSETDHCRLFLRLTNFRTTPLHDAPSWHGVYLNLISLVFC